MTRTILRKNTCPKKAYLTRFAFLSRNMIRRMNRPFIFFPLSDRFRFLHFRNTLEQACAKKSA